MLALGRVLIGVAVWLVCGLVALGLKDLCLDAANEVERSGQQAMRLAKYHWGKELLLGPWSLVRWALALHFNSAMIEGRLKEEE